MENESQAFACVVTKKGEVFWKMGEDGTSNLAHMFWLEKNKRFIEEKALVQIIPVDNNYCHITQTKMTIDEGTAPKWWEYSHTILAREAMEEWKKKLYSIMDVTKYPKNPFLIKAPPLEQKHIDLLKEVKQVSDNIAMVIIQSICQVVGTSVWSSLRDSVENMERGVSWTHIVIQLGYMFNVPFIGYEGCSEYPCQAEIELAKDGFIPGITGGGRGVLCGSTTGDGIVCGRLYDDIDLS